MDAERIEIESDERGFELHVWVDEIPYSRDDDGHMVVNIQNVDLDAFYDQVRSRIGPYLRERDEARRTAPVRFECDPDESGGYDLSDPKHPDWHSVHADLYDNREKV
jgi:hypothetical protein